MEICVAVYPIRTPSQLAHHIRALRLSKHWSQSQLGSATGLSQSRIARIEANPLAISVQQLLGILTILGASMAIDTRPDAKTEPIAHHEEW